MTALERGVYVTVGAADLAIEKIRELPVVEQFRGRTWIEGLREFEPKVRKQTQELQVRGEKVITTVRTRADRLRERAETLPADARKQVQQFPQEARKQIGDLRTDARNQVKDLQGRVEKVWGQLARNGNGESKKPQKTKATAESKAS